MINVKPIASNQTLLTMSPGIEILFSYRTPVAGHVNGQFIKTAKFHSVTTSRHINKYLDGRPAVIKPQKFFEKLLEMETIK
jgi:hypothetical protein